MVLCDQLAQSRKSMDVKLSQVCSAELKAEPVYQFNLYNTLHLAPWFFLVDQDRKIDHAPERS